MQFPAVAFQLHGRGVSLFFLNILFAFFGLGEGCGMFCLFPEKNAHAGGEMEGLVNLFCL